MNHIFKRMNIHYKRIWAQITLSDTIRGFLLKEQDLWHHLMRAVTFVNWEQKI